MAKKKELFLESLVRPSAIKQARIKIPAPASKESFNMTFVQDVGNKTQPDGAPAATPGPDRTSPEKKCVLKITKGQNQDYKAFVKTAFKTPKMLRNNSTPF